MKGKKIVAAAMTVVLSLGIILIAGCGKTKQAVDTGITRLADLEGKKVASRTGSIFCIELDKKVDDVEHLFFNDTASQLEAVASGKAAAVLLDEPVAHLATAQYPVLGILDEKLAEDNYGFAFRKGDPLAEAVSGVIARFREDGTLRDIGEKWFGADESVKVLPELTYKTDFDGSAGLIRFGHDNVMVPMGYMGSNGSAKGYDVELAMRIAYELNMEIEMTGMSFDALLVSLNSGKSDMVAGCMSITEERKKSVDFSIPYYIGGMVAVVKQDTGEGNTTELSETTKSPSGFASFKESFTKTFITENRYQLILQGLGTTLLISILSVLLGTVLGFGVCMLRRAKNPWLNIPAKMFIRLIQGIPIVVILMILFYLVFTDPNASPIMVAVIGFAINFAAYVSEMMRTGIDAVDKGQLEAASAIGFNKFQVFCKITLPQAARHVLPVFKGEFISLVKMTSVVGYIAIQDLTKMTDIIRSRTYEAFFPLIVTAVLYFALSYLLTLLLSLIEIKIDPQHRKRIVKGVNNR